MGKRSDLMLCALAVAFPLTSASARNITILPGHSAELGPVYWINNCNSMLKDAGGVARVDGIDVPSGVTLSLRRGNVTTGQCGNIVPGATVIATARKHLPPGSYTVNYIVHYNASDGEHESSHSQTLVVP